VIETYFKFAVGMHATHLYSE